MLGLRSSARTTSPLQKTTTSATSLSATAGFRITLRCVSHLWDTPAYFSTTPPIFSSTYLRAVALAPLPPSLRARRGFRAARGIQGTRRAARFDVIRHLEVVGGNGRQAIRHHRRACPCAHGPGRRCPRGLERLQQRRQECAQCEA